MQRRRPQQQRLIVLGLDCATLALLQTPQGVWLPNIRHLAEQGTWGVLRSSIPCITVPAWASMLSSRDPGVLGVYGFRNRADWSYDALTTADSRAIQVPRVWDVLGAAGKQSLVVSVPQTYPLNTVKGTLVSDFLTPGRESAFAYPALVRADVLQRFPDLTFDIANFRTADKADLLARIHTFTAQQYDVLIHLLATRTWDFGIHVNMGTDRIHHGFWRYHDPQHRLYETGNPYADAIHDYYAALDQHIGRVLAAVPDDTIVALVSDHGVKRMDGAIALNEWLRLNGWLTLKQPLPEGVTRFDPAMVDWSRTRAWSTGGYYGRVFLNIAGREPQGIIAPEAVDAVGAELSAALGAIPDDMQRPLNTRVFRPQAIYQQLNGQAPDLIVYFGDLHWRTVGGLGYGQHYTLENDTGPDDANHAEEGMFMLYDPHQRGQGQIADRQLMDIAPTILTRLGVRVPREMQGHAF